MQAFIGTKLVLLIGDRLLTYRRDDFAHLPWPDRWDLPGGGREGGESAEACVLRETYEEFGLSLTVSDLIWTRQYAGPDQPGAIGVFFAAKLPAAAQRAIVFGSEGQEWRLMAPEAYMTHPRAVPHFRERVRDALTGLAGRDAE